MAVTTRRSVSPSTSVNTLLLAGKVFHLTDLDGRVVEGPAEPTHGRVAVHLAGDGKLLQPGSAVDTLLTGVALRRNCANNIVSDTH